MIKLLEIILIIIIAMFSCGACGIKQPHPQMPAGYISPEVRPYVDIFYKELRKYRFVDDMRLERTYRKWMPIYIVEKLNSNLTAKDTAAYCVASADYGKWIEIRSDLWNIFSDASREQLVLHECAHCVLDLGHVEPESGKLMSPYMMPDEEWLANRDSLIKEMMDSYD